MNFDIDTAAASGKAMMPSLPQVLRHTCPGGIQKSKDSQKKNTMWR